MDHVRFRRRAAAFIVDLAILMPLSWAVLSFGLIGLSFLAATLGFMFVGWEFALVERSVHGGMFLYFALFHASAWQATPGKRLLSIRVTDRSGRKLTLGRSLWRTLMEVVLSIPVGLTYWTALIRRDRLALHDMAAGTQLRIERPSRG